MPTVPLWKELNLFLHTYSNCIFHEICRPENPQRRTSIELEDIKKSLQDNGCWPFHPSGPILLDSEDDEDDNSPILKKPARGASKNSSDPVPSTSQESNDAVPSTSQESNLTVGKGKGKGKGNLNDILESQYFLQSKLNLVP